MHSYEIATFYDVHGSGAIPKHTAALLMEHLKPIFKMFNGTQFSEPIPHKLRGDPLSVDPRELSFDATRSLFLTKRKIILPEDADAALERDTFGICHRRSNGSFTAVATIPHMFDTEPKLDAVLGEVAHELGHGFGIVGHCATSSCVMFPRPMESGFNIAQPFCDKHVLSSL